MSPCIISTSILEIARPKPVPSLVLFFSRSTRSNLPKSLPIFSSLIPIPVSDTAMMSSMTDLPSGLFSPFLPVIFSETLPSSVYFTALFRMFVITCLTLTTSPKSLSGRFSSTSVSKVRFFCLALKLIMLLTSLMTELSWYSTSTISILPSSIFEKSRMSLMMARRLLPALSTLPE